MGKYNANVTMDPTKITTEEAWALGFFAADGGIYKSKREKDPPVIQFCIHNKDVDVLYKIKNILHLEHPVKKHLNNQDKLVAMLRFSTPEYLTIFEYFHMKKETPGFAFECIRTRHYIRGLFDGDGCLHHRKRKGFMMVFVNESERIVRDVAYLISRDTGISFKIPKRIDRDNLYRIQYESREARILAWYLYSGDIVSLSMNRKREEYRKLVTTENYVDQFFQCIFGKELRYTPKIKNNGLVLPLSCGPQTDSLKVCNSIKDIAKCMGINITPIPVNTGKYKYYAPYIPIEDASCINMLRPFVNQMVKA
jgi:hypothetical protein